MSLLLGFLFFYDNWGSMIANFLAIASAFIEIDAALGTKSPAVRFTQMYQGVFDDQEFANIFNGIDFIFPREIKYPVHVEG